MTPYEYEQFRKQRSRKRKNKGRSKQKNDRRYEKRLFNVPSRVNRVVTQEEDIDET